MGVVTVSQRYDLQRSHVPSRADLLAIGRCYAGSRKFETSLSCQGDFRVPGVVVYDLPVRRIHSPVGWVELAYDGNVLFIERIKDRPRLKLVSEHLVRAWKALEMIVIRSGIDLVEGRVDIKLVGKKDDVDRTLDTLYDHADKLSRTVESETPFVFDLERQDHEMKPAGDVYVGFMGGNFGAHGLRKINTG